jgi:hypothetical protein
MGTYPGIYREETVCFAECQKAAQPWGTLHADDFCVGTSGAVEKLLRHPQHSRLREDSTIDSGSGWFWRTAEGKALILEINVHKRNKTLPIDDLEFGWQREED